MPTFDEIRQACLDLLGSDDVHEQAQLVGGGPRFAVDHATEVTSADMVELAKRIGEFSWRIGRDPRRGYPGLTVSITLKTTQ